MFTGRDSLLMNGLVIPILLVDDAILVVSKPAGLVTHPAYRHPDGTLTDAIFAAADGAGVARPWLLHRLDRETSGVTLLARTEASRRALVWQFQQRRIGKRYLALVSGQTLPDAGTVDAPLARDPADRRRVVITPDGKPAQTQFRVLARVGTVALVLAEPLTGRTHQIRAHLTSLGNPLVGDTLYGGVTVGNGETRTMLHAWELRFRHPSTGEDTTVRASVPADMSAVLYNLGLGDAISAIHQQPAISDMTHVGSCR